MAYTGFGLDQIHPPVNKSFNQMTPEEQAEKGATMMINFMSSCPGKTVVSGVTGFGLGGIFGLFMSSMAYDTPVQLATNVKTIADMTMKQQLRVQFADMYKKSISSAKSFGYMGLVYSGVECVVESARAKNDINNGLIAGCITGGGLAYKGGPQAAFMGCVGFAAFSLAIDTYMKMEDGKPPVNDFNE
ncbi:hypothetical protein KAFR_0A07600 [Kazachstania africana CBS 2517]|uniref:Mitochondrial import inner membrane translocase subunit TIM22 n=1 Tax=Kazachstania africana (strain ATCC 22294 / BCRC 22015 / CBS 2517 / CECT 1963 / NBRC 1671 / NRRL Y-8276) TaxID=1071382 RepID=H2AP94_KAZAF|nr:hypothetical protein KAFR_0A07600 [Kazachstania africana CBS 2517]CCF56194.1 hypothetical protein KAFR_0A07600 [Kazachstania africana CBS 2517]